MPARVHAARRLISSGPRCCADRLSSLAPCLPACLPAWEDMPAHRAGRFPVDFRVWAKRVAPWLPASSLGCLHPRYDVNLGSGYDVTSAVNTSSRHSSASLMGSNTSPTKPALPQSSTNALPTNISIAGDSRSFPITSLSADLRRTTGFTRCLIRPD